MGGPGDPMDAQRWERVEALFHAATERPAEERESYLAAACGGDTALLEQVRAMLAIDAEANALLDGGLAPAAEAILGVPDGTLPRQRFGPYRVTGVLGEGGMGVVYRGHRDDLASDAALKVLRDAALSPARRERFAFEQRVLAQLNHPAIARLYDADALADGTPWIAMELVEGEPIAAFCRGRALPIEARLRLFREVCEAVQYAHGQAILHRDLKPSNILVRADGRVKLLDFGISKSLEAIETAEDATRTGLRLMTPAYAAPEQVLGGPLGVHTDVYSLGVVLYELLAGRLPFDLAGRTPSEAATILTEQPVRRPSQLARESGGPAADAAAWGDLDVLCATAMHRDPQRRYRTVDALLRDVDRYLANEPLEARGDSFRYRAGKFVKRHALAVGASAAVLALLVTVVAVYTARLAESRNAAVAEAKRALAVEGFLDGLLQGGDETAGASDTLRVLTLLDRGVERAGLLAGHPAQQANLERTLGGAFQAQSDLGKAERLLTSAYAHTLRQPHPAAADVVRDQIALSGLRTAQARHDEAIRLARQAQATAARGLHEDDPLVRQAAGTLGFALVEAGDYDGALPVLERAVRASEPLGQDSDELAESLTNLANAYDYLGRYRESDSLNRWLLERTKRVRGPRHPDIADQLLNIAAIQLDRGRYAEAEQSSRQALDVARGWYGENHTLTADCLGYVARALTFEGRFAEADTLARRSIAIKVRVLGPTHPDVAGTLSTLGSLALQADRHDEALALFGRAAGIYRSAFGPHSAKLAILLANMGSVELQRSDPVRAERDFRDALEAYAGAVPPDNLNVGIGRIKLGRALLRQKRYAEAAHESHAGYDIVAPQAEPSISFLVAARTDLIAAYGALGQPDSVARFRAEAGRTGVKR